MSKKIISFMLSVMLLLSVFTFSTSAAPAVDLADSPYQEAAQIMVDLGVMSLDAEGKFNPTAEITVGEFTAAVLKLAKIDASATVPQPRYADVTASHTYAKEVEMAHQMNIYRGLTQTNFGVDDKLTIGVAVQQALNAAGYGEYADVRGGYPTGYMVVAAENDVIDKVVSEKVAITRGEAADILYNTLFLHTITAVMINGNVQYTQSTTNTVLSQVYGAYYTSGVVTGNQYVTLPTYDGVPVTSTVIDDVIYTLGAGVDVTPYFGQYVSAIYTAKANSCTLIAAAPVSGKNQILTLPLADVTDITTTEVIYEPETATKETKYKHSAEYILNNYEVADMFSATEYTVPENGTITMIDNNRDGKYDVVLMDTYEIVVVNSVDANNEVIYAKHPVGVSYDLSVYDKYSIISEKGVESKISNIKNGNVLLIRKYPDNKYIQINIVKESKYIEVSEILESIEVAGEDTVVVIKAGEDEYEISPVYYNDNPGFLPTLGSTYLATFDDQGKIVDLVIDSSSSGMSFGYLIKANTITEGDDEILKAKIFNQKGETVYYECDEYLVYSGRASDQTEISSQKKRYDVVLDYLKHYTKFQNSIDSNAQADMSYYDATGFDPDLVAGGFAIRYKIDANNVITAIETPYELLLTDASGNQQITTMEGFRKAYVAPPSTSLRVKGSVNLGGSIIISDNTETFQVAPYEKLGDIAAYTKGFPIENEDYFSNLFAYSCSLDSGAAEYIIYRDTASSATYKSGARGYVFVKWIETYDVDTMETSKTMVVYSQSGQFEKFALDPEVTVTYSTSKDADSLVPGDYLRLFLVDNKIRDVQVMFEYDTKTLKTGNASSGGSGASNTLAAVTNGEFIGYGTYAKRLGDAAYFRQSGSQSIMCLHNFSNVSNVIVVDFDYDITNPANAGKEDKMFTLGSKEDIKTEADAGSVGRASKCFAHIKEGSFRTLIVYKNMR